MREIGGMERKNAQGMVMEGKSRKRKYGREVKRC